MISKNNINTSLTVVLPIRIVDIDSPLFMRLQRNPKLDKNTPETVQFIVVDDGSTPECALAIKAICKKSDYQYVYLNTGDKQFSIGRCRNEGAMRANTPYVFFQDVDLLPTDNFYSELIEEIHIQNLAANPADFIMVPCVYLTETASDAFFDYLGSLRRRYYFNACLEGNEMIVEKYSSGTSACLYNRHFYLSSGGNDPEFEGWGFDDLEFNCRQIRKSNKFLLPDHWALDQGNFGNQLDFNGWKSVYRLYGDLLGYKGLVLFHEWHSVDEGSPYNARSHQNEILFNQKVRVFKDKGTEPEALPDLNAGKTLLFRKNAFTFNRTIRPLLGEVLFEDVEDFKDKASLYKYVKQNDVSRILFHNPYATEKMQRVYECARALKVPYIVAERGALDNSVFYDASGFLCDSGSYDAALWDMTLTAEQENAISQYIVTAKSQPDPLEQQGARLSQEKLKQKFKINDKTKILFVALQRPGDTVTRHFMQDLSYGQYIEMINQTLSALPENWKAIVKKHPLEDEMPVTGDFIDAKDCHIYDLLAVSDAILTFNSGVGILAMLWGVPTLYAGKAFYAIEGVNKYVASMNDVKTALFNIFKPDQAKIYRFLYHLVFSVYSFGSLVTRSTNMPDGSRMTATTDIKFLVLSWPENTQRILFKKTDSDPKISWSSPLFDRYRYSAIVNRQYDDAGKDVTYMHARRISPIEHLIRSMPFWTKTRFMRKTRKLIFSPVIFFKDMQLNKKKRIK